MAEINRLEGDRDFWKSKAIELQAKADRDEEQLVQIVNFLGGDARDVKGEDKSIAGLVKERFAELRESLIVRLE